MRGELSDNGDKESGLGSEVHTAPVDVIGFG